MPAKPMHLDGESIANEINAAVDAASVDSRTATFVADSTATVATTGVTTPANAAYTQADQTALADAVLSLATAVDSLIGTVNDILAALETAGIMAAS